MNWQEVIKKINEEFPQLTPDKLYNYVKKTYGSESDIKDLNKQWSKLVVKSIKNFKGVPDEEDRKKLSVEKRINYFIQSKVSNGVGSYFIPNTTMMDRNQCQI